MQVQADGACAAVQVEQRAAAAEGLSDDDVEAVIAFVRTEQERLGFEG